MNIEIEFGIISEKNKTLIDKKEQLKKSILSGSSSYVRYYLIAQIILLLEDIAAHISVYNIIANLSQPELRIDLPAGLENDVRNMRLILRKVAPQFI